MPVRRARDAVAAVFLLNGLAFATWVSRIPEVRTLLDLTPGRLGTLLLALAAGAVVALPSTGLLVHRFGAARVVASAAVLTAVGLAVAGVSAGAGTVAGTATGLVLMGLGSGSWDVAMNVEGAVVERHLRRTVMPRFHAAFSLGTVAGAGLGALAAWTHLPVPGHALAGAAVTASLPVLASRWFLPSDVPDRSAPTTGPVAGEAPTGAPAGEGAVPGVLRAWTEPRTLALGVLVLALALTEGTANDWLAVALVDGYGAHEAVGATGFAVFVAAMTAGRLGGTVLLDRLGRVPVLVGSMLVAGLGVGVVVLAGSLPWAMAGIVLWGVGASLGFPVGMSAAADDPRRAAARVSVVSTIGYTAFLAGPPLLGYLGDHVGVLNALLAVAVLLVPSLLAVRAARPTPPAG